ncbi:HVO_2072 family ArtA-dependent S-layer glycoprotein, partial [Haloplanus salinarum]
MVLSVVAVATPAAAAPQASLTADGPDSPAQQGDSFEITYELTNNGDEDAGTGGLELTLPDGVTVDTDASSGDGNINPDAVFYTNGVAQDETKTTTLVFDVADDASTGDVTVTADGFVGTESNETVDTSVTIEEADDDDNGDSTPTSPGADNRAANTDGTGDFDTRDGEGAIFPGATVYQGESDVQLGDSFSGTPTKEAGDDEGVTLETPDLPQSQSTGRYSDDSGNTVTVQTPRVTTLEIINSNGETIEGGSVREGSDNAGSGVLSVVAAWNYQDAEDLELTVEDEGGLDVTGDVLEGSDAFATASDQGTNPYSSRSFVDVASNEAIYPIDLSDSGTGTYTVSVAGSDDLDFGEASQSTTVTVTGDDDANLNFDADELTRGEEVRFEIQGSDAGDTHTVLIEEDEFRDGVSAENAQKIFRQVGDTDEVGVVTGDGTNAVPRGSPVNDDIDYAYATITIDDGTGVGVGQIETQYLDDSDVDVYLYEQGYDVPFDEATSEAEDAEEDDQSISVEEGDLTIESPGNNYVVGSEVDINGTASEGIDEVAFYARRNNDYEHVPIDGADTITVDADDTFEEEDIVLSADSQILSQPGTYRFGVIDVDGLNQPVTDDLTTSEFNTNTSAQQSLRVTDTELTANIKTVGGQVSTTDQIVNISGSAFGANTVDVVFVGDRGGTYVTDLSVDDDNTFSEDEVTISGLAGSQTVSVHVLFPGRDGNYGDTDTSDIGEIVPSDGTLTGEQVRARIVDDTTEATASDDRMVTATFRYADAQSTIQNVYPEGMEASG